MQDKLELRKQLRTQRAETRDNIVKLIGITLWGDYLKRKNQMFHLSSLQQHATNMDQARIISAAVVKNIYIGATQEEIERLAGKKPAQIVEEIEVMYNALAQERDDVFKEHVGFLEMVNEYDRLYDKEMAVKASVNTMSGLHSSSQGKQVLFNKANHQVGGNGK